jgi:chemotaxis protein CheC
MNQIEKSKYYSEEQLDFLKEMMNIGAGHTAILLSQMLNCKLDLKMPKLNILPVGDVGSIFEDPRLPVNCVKMKMLGDVSGHLFFILPYDQRANVKSLMEKSAPHLKEMNHDDMNSFVMELGNIAAGAYLGAIHDFCKLKIHHSVPILLMDMFQSLLDESLVVLSSDVQELIMIENEFITDMDRIRAFFFIIPTMKSLQTMVDSIEQARMAYIET